MKSMDDLTFSEDLFCRIWLKHVFHASDSIEEELLFELGVDYIPNLGVLCPLCVRSPLKETNEVPMG